MLLVAALAGLAAAHPMAVRVADHDTRVELDQGEVRLTYQVQFPMHTATDRLELADTTELAAGILVRVDDQTVLLDVVGSGEQTVDHVSHAWLELRGRLPGPHPASVEVSLANYPDYPGIFRWSALLHREHAVLDTNLRFEKDGVPRIYTEHPLHGDDWRTLQLDLAPSGPLDAAWAALTPELPVARPLADALHQPWWAGFVGGASGPALLLVGAGLAGLAGTGASSREPRDRQVVIMSFLAWLTLAFFRVGAPVGAVVTVAGATALLVGAARRSEALTTPLSALLAATWAVTMGAGGAGFVVWACWGMGRAASSSERRQAGLWFAASTSALLLLIRGIGALMR